MARPGPKSYLDDEVNLLEIRRFIHNGMSLADISQKIGVSEDTVYDWKYRNYKNFADKVLQYEQERKLAKAEGRLEELMYSDNEKIALGASTFIAETLGKGKGYSKRTELTGADGQDLIYKWDGYTQNSNTVQSPALDKDIPREQSSLESPSSSS